MDTDLDKLIWSQFYAGIMSMACHPGNVKSFNMEIPSVLRSAVLADQMFREYRKRFNPKYEE